jgi:hypothetical protein
MMGDENSVTHNGTLTICGLAVGRGESAVWVGDGIKVETTARVSVGVAAGSGKEVLPVIHARVNNMVEIKSSKILFSFIFPMRV